MQLAVTKQLDAVRRTQMQLRKIVLESGVIELARKNTKTMDKAKQEFYGNLTDEFEFMLTKLGGDNK